MRPFRGRSCVEVATLRLFDAGRNVEQVAEWLGHADAAFTLRTYIHLIDDRMGGADFFDDLVGVKSESESGVSLGVEPSPATTSAHPVP